MDKDKILIGDEHSRIAIIKSTLLFWREYPEAALICEVGHLEERDFRKLLLGLRACYIDFNGPIRTLALSFIAAIFDPSIFIKWAADIQTQSYGKYWRMHSSTVSMLSRDAINLESHQKCALAKDLLSLICHMFKVQSAVMNIFNISYLDTFLDVPEKYQVVANFEMAFICLVTSQDYNVSRVAVAAMTCFLQCISTTESMEENSYINYENFEIYNDFVKKFGQQYWSKVFSPKAHQKRIRNMLKSITGLSLGIIGAWEEMSKRWRTFCSVLIPVKHTNHTSMSHTSIAMNRNSHTSSYGSLNELGDLPSPKYKGRGALVVKSMMMESQHLVKPVANSNIQPQDYYNVAGMMVCITNLLLNESENNQKDDSVHSSIVSIPIPSERYVKEVLLKDMAFSEETNTSHFKFITLDILDSAKPHLSNSVHNFIDEVISVLLTDNVPAREMISEILGYDISGQLCVNMCKLWCRVLHDQIADVTDASQLEKETLIADTILFIAAAILSRTEDILTGGSGLSRLEKNSVPLEQICALLTTWVNNVSTPAEQQEKIKAKIANLTIQLVQRSHIVGIKNENAWKNEIFDAVLEWSGIYKLSANQKFDFENRKTFEFNMTLQKCMTCLLKDLPVNKSFEGTNKNLVAANDSDARSNLFFKYFRFFLKALDVVKAVNYIN